MTADLPLDSDRQLGEDTASPAAGAALPAHGRPFFWGMVWLGGTAGTATRYLLSYAVPHVWRVPVAIVGINVLGAFLLGLLIAALARRGADTGRRRVLRLLLGTGFLGGFTTYSALAVDAVSLAGDGLLSRGIGYALATVLLGGLASWAGIALGSVPATELEGTT